MSNEFAFALPFVDSWILPRFSFQLRGTINWETTEPLEVDYEGLRFSIFWVCGIKYLLVQNDVPTFQRTYPAFWFPSFLEDRLDEIDLEKTSRFSFDSPIESAGHSRHGNFIVCLEGEDLHSALRANLNPFQYNAMCTKRRQIKFQVSPYMDEYLLFRQT